MIRIAVILISFCFVLLACGSHKQVTKTEHKASENIEAHIADKDSLQVDSSVSTRDSVATESTEKKVEIVTSDTDDEKTTITREYDTDKPIDPVTGRPPLKKEVTETSHKTDKTKTAIATDNNSTLNAKKTEQTAVKTTATSEKTKDIAKQSDIDVIIEDTKKRGLNGLQNFLCWLGGSVLLIAIAWFTWKRFNKHLKTF